MIQINTVIISPVPHSQKRRLKAALRDFVGKLRRFDHYENYVIAEFYCFQEFGRAIHLSGWIPCDDTVFTIETYRGELDNPPAVVERRARSCVNLATTRIIDPARSSFESPPPPTATGTTTTTTTATTATATTATTAAVETPTATEVESPSLYRHPPSTPMRPRTLDILNK